MKAFKCSNCGKISYSSADLDRQTNTGCPYCKGVFVIRNGVQIPYADLVKEVGADE